MAETIVLLAVTKMLAGFCIAGIDDRGAWSRPVKRFGSLALGDVSYADRRMMQPFEHVRFEVERARPDPPHVEDRICDFVRRRPQRVAALADHERAAFLAAHAEEDPAPIVNHQRSLALLRVDEVDASFQLDPYSGKYEARVQVPGIGEARGIPCTDLRWRALGRALLPKGGTVALDRAALESTFGTQEIYLALGLARQFDGRFWPLVVGMHLVPDFKVTIDPQNP